MEGNETNQIEVKKADVRRQTSGSEVLQSQITLDMASHVSENTIEGHDDFFIQDGFSYTGLLLGGLIGRVTYDQYTDKVWTECHVTNKTEHNSLIDYNSSGNVITTARSSNDIHSHMCMASNEETTTSFLADDNENPWDVNMFNNIELDKVFDRETTSTDKETNEPTATQFSEAKTQPGIYHGEASRNTTTDNVIHTDSSADQHAEITEEDIQTFLARDNLSAEDREKFEKLAAEFRERKAENDSTDDFKPEVGMQFETREEAQKFINLYAYVVGFSVAVVSSYRTASKTRTKEVIRFTM